MKLTQKEQRAIRLLNELAKDWPQSLSLFSWAGSLKVMKSGKGVNMRDAVVEDIRGIPNDGGDPDLDQPSE